MIRNLMLLGLCSFISLPAEAAPITYSFTGTIQQIGSRIPEPLSVGQQIPIVITLDANAQATQGATPGSYSSFTPYLFTSATFAGVDHAGGLQQTIAITTPSSIDFHVVGLQTSFGFDLLLSGALPGVLPNGDLPLAIDPSQFTGGTFSVTDAFSPSYFGYSGTINLVAVPEPATMVILFGGLLALCAARGRSGAQGSEPCQHLGDDGLRRSVRVRVGGRLPELPNRPIRHRK